MTDIQHWQRAEVNKKGSSWVRSVKKATATSAARSISLIRAATSTVQGAGMGITKNVYKAHLRVYNASGVEVGPTFDELTEYKQRTTESPGTPPALKTGEIEVAIRPAWDQDGVICIRQEDPLPLKVLSLALELGV